MFIDTEVNYSQSVEIRSFRYFVAGVAVAEIEILCFSDGKYAGQGKIRLLNNENFATSSVFADINSALKKCYELIESKISNHDWVLKTIKTIENY